MTRQTQPSRLTYLSVVYHHIAASGWIITGNTIIQLYTIHETRKGEKICPGTHARLIKI